MNVARSSFFIIIFFIIGGLAYLLAPVLTPFLLSLLLAYLVDPLVNRLTQYRMNRILAVSLVFFILTIILLLFVLLLIPVIQAQINNLILVLPNMIEWLQQKVLPWIMLHFNAEAPINIETLKSTLTKNWATAGSYVGIAFNTIIHSGFLILNWLMNLVLIPVVTFYLLCDWQRILIGIKNLLPRNIAPTVIRLARECDQVLSAFFRGQLLVMFFTGVYYSIGLSWVGLSIGIILGMTIGLISIIPYLGFIIGITISSIAVLVQLGSLKPLLFTWGLFAVGQILESFFLTPYLIGDRIGLHPVIVIFAILAGGSLFGFFGILLALPIAAVLMVWLRFLIARYHESSLYQ